jgi:uncharacterized protein YbjT (DUF2867 family)
MTSRPPSSIPAGEPLRAPQTLLVTGATGYIASRLIPRLLQAGYRVRCLARQPDRLKGRVWYPLVEVVRGDVTQPESLPEAMQGISAAYYLIHSMSTGRGYDRVDLQSARNFSQAALQAGIEHIIYLGGLADARDPALTMHLRSRIESGAALREAGVPVTEFRAGVIIGPGSVSFEMIRFIAEQFPLMVGPRWLRNHSQPVATGNVLDYLVAALDTTAARGLVIELGSQVVYSYIDVMCQYARIRGLKRLPLLLPGVPLGMMAFFIAHLTPVVHSYAVPLVEGLQSDSLVQDHSPMTLFPQISLLDYNTAVLSALADTHPAKIERVWLDLESQAAVQLKHEGMFIDYRLAQIAAPPAQVLQGLRRQMDEQSLNIWPLHSFAIDFEKDDCLRLCVTQPIPGLAWLEWKVLPHAWGTQLQQTAFFAPKGLPGFLSWYLLNPLFRRGLARILKEATNQGLNPEN